MNQGLFADETALERALSEPSPAATAVLRGIQGDIVVLGAGGKMGPTLCMMLRRAVAGNRVVAVSRFSRPQVQSRIRAAGVETLVADLLETRTFPSLPEAGVVFYLLGMKFGATGREPLTWALNTHVPCLVSQRYPHARIVALSTGNVYPLVPIESRGATEETTPEPIGEYAQSCLGRERLFEFFAEENGTPMTLIRLNYSNEPRYGIIVDLTRKVLDGTPIDLTMGHVNLIWQRDANDLILQSAALADCPPKILNLTGLEIISVRTLAERIGYMLDRKPVFTGQEAADALLSDAGECSRLLGPPRTSLDEMLRYIVPWVAAGKSTLNKPTRYETRTGRF